MSIFDYFLGAEKRAAATEVDESGAVTEVTFQERCTLGIKLALVGGAHGPKAVAVIAMPRDPASGALGRVEGTGKVRLGDELLAVSDGARMGLEQRSPRSRPRVATICHCPLR